MKKIVVVGVGNPLNSDKWIGCYASRMLEKDLEDIQFIVSSNPKKHIKEITAPDPEYIFVLSALDIEKKPGEIRVLDTRVIQDPISKYYNKDLTLFLKELKKDTKAIIRIIGIQPKKIDYGKEISEEVKKSIPKIKKKLKEFL